MPSNKQRMNVVDPKLTKGVAKPQATYNKPDKPQKLAQTMKGMA